MEDIEVYDGPYFLGETISWFWTTSPLNVSSYTGELCLYGRRVYCSGGESLWLKSLSRNFRSSISYAGLMPQSTLSIKNMRPGHLVHPVTFFLWTKREEKNLPRLFSFIWHPQAKIIQMYINAELLFVNLYLAGIKSSNLHDTLMFVINLRPMHGQGCACKQSASYICCNIYTQRKILLYKAY